MAVHETIDVRSTTREELIDITRLVRDAIRSTGVTSGLAVVFVPHTTAAIALQENSDPSVKSDMLSHLRALVPRDVGSGRHADDNVDAHIKAAIVGQSLTVVVDGGKPVLGQWQAVFFCEFDGPRQRRVLVRAVADAAPRRAAP